MRSSKLLLILVLSGHVRAGIVQLFPWCLSGGTIQPCVSSSIVDSGPVILPPATSVGTPTAPTVVVHGTTGSTHYAYITQWLTSNGWGPASPQATITNGNATLSVSNYQQVSTGTCPSRATGFRVIRIPEGGTGESYWIGDGSCGSSVNDQTNTFSRCVFPGNVAPCGPFPYNIFTTDTSVNPALVTQSLTPIGSLVGINFIATSPGEFPFPGAGFFTLSCAGGCSITDMFNNLANLSLGTVTGTAAQGLAPTLDTTVAANGYDGGEYAETCDATSGNVSVTLPSATGSTNQVINVLNGQTFLLKKIDSSANTCSLVAAGGENIEGSSTFTLTKQNEVVAIAADSNNALWRIYWHYLPGVQTQTNCASSASPAVCGSASAGSVTVAAAATTVQVNTTAVTANSQIFVMYDSSLSTRLSVTCNATEPALYGVTARSAGSSFTITASAPVTNPACFSYFIVN